MTTTAKHRPKSAAARNINVFPAKKTVEPPSEYFKRGSWQCSDGAAHHWLLNERGTIEVCTQCTEVRIMGEGLKRTCERCGGELVIRQNRETKEHFAGCSNWPQCEQTEELPMEFKLRLMGAPVLPGFDGI